MENKLKIWLTIRAEMQHFSDWLLRYARTSLFDPPDTPSGRITVVSAKRQAWALKPKRDSVEIIAEVHDRQRSDYSINMYVTYAMSEHDCLRVSINSDFEQLQAYAQRLRGAILSEYEEVPEPAKPQQADGADGQAAQAQPTPTSGNDGAGTGTQQSFQKILAKSRNSEEAQFRYQVLVLYVKDKLKVTKIADELSKSTDDGDDVVLNSRVKTALAWLKQKGFIPQKAVRKRRRKIAKG